MLLYCSAIVTLVRLSLVTIKGYLLACLHPLACLNVSLSMHIAGAVVSRSKWGSIEIYWRRWYCGLRRPHICNKTKVIEFYCSCAGTVIPSPLFHAGGRPLADRHLGIRPPLVETTVSVLAHLTSTFDSGVCIYCDVSKYRDIYWCRSIYWCRNKGNVCCRRST